MKVPMFPVTRWQASGRLRAHYHCVVCSVTIARKTDMVSHLKRHVNKGETEASYSGGPDVVREDHGSDPAAGFTSSAHLRATATRVVSCVRSSVGSRVRNHEGTGHQRAASAQLHHAAEERHLLQPQDEDQQVSTGDGWSRA